MHELSLALSLVEIAREEGARLGGQVSAVHVRLGALAGVVREALLSSYEMASADTPLAGSRLVIEDVPVVVVCPQCGEQQLPDASYWMGCPACGTPTPEVRQGRELELVALEIDP
jgi:hydrogenase nickel incorporation protein HypA/HybF